MDRLKAKGIGSNDKSRSEEAVRTAPGALASRCLISTYASDSTKSTWAVMGAIIASRFPALLITSKV
jgi:hypothetical protein